MTLTFKSFNAKNTAAIYTGAKNPVRFSLSAFPDKVAPPTIEIADGVLATKSVKEPKVKLTAEERKAARAAAPKLTLAERAERARVRAEKLAAEAAAETQPSL